MKILFVCTGNTCRSAMAEGLMKELLEKNGLHNITVISRGIYASSGSNASDEAIAALKNLYKIDISKHSSALLTFNDIQSSDFIYAMTDNHKNLINTTLEDEEMSMKIKNFAETDIEDPYMGSKKVYEQCARAIYKGIVEIIDDIRSVL